MNTLPDMYKKATLLSESQAERPCSPRNAGNGIVAIKQHVRWVAQGYFISLQLRSSPSFLYPCPCGRWAHLSLPPRRRSCLRAPAIHDADDGPVATTEHQQYTTMDPYSRSRYEQGIDSKIVIMGNSGLSALEPTI